MIGWNPSYNWTYDEFVRAMQYAFVVENRQSVCLDVEHSDRKNMDDIILWAQEMGYHAEEKNIDTIKVWK